MENLKVIIQKVVAVLTVFIIIMTQYVITGILETTYAIDLLATQSDNVQFRAYFKNGEEELTEIESDISSKNLKLKIDVAVKNEGYFNGQISLENTGFNIIQATENNYIKEIKNNVIYLNQLNAEETANIEVGIECLREDSISATTFNKQSSVKLIGTYVSSNGNVDIDSLSQVKVTWKVPEGTKAELASKILTNSIYRVDVENKKIVQFLISSKLTNNAYPIKNTEIKASVPEGATKVEVHKRTTKSTNGEQDFTDANYTFSNNLLTISVNNDEIDGKISWMNGVQDIYVVSYEYLDTTDLSTQNITINEKITLQNDVELNAEEPVQLALNETKDGIASVSKLEAENNIYKGKIYSGEARDFTSYTIVYADYVDGLKDIEITENEAKYKKEQEESNANVEIKTIKVNKNQVSRVLGNTWTITVGENIVTNETETDENGDITLQLTEGIKTATIKTSKPVNNGSFIIETVKTIKDTTNSREDKKQFTALKDNASIKYVKNDDNVFTFTSNNEIELKETESKASIQCEQQALIASGEEQQLNLTVVLDSSNEQKDLYKNPEIKIKLPKKIKNVTSVQFPQLMYANGLSLTEENYKIEEENGQKIISVKLTGEQTSYLGDAIQGVTIPIKTMVKIDQNTENSEEQIVLNYTNENATIYADQGTQNVTVQIVANQSQNQNQNQNQNQAGNTNDNETIQLNLTAEVGGEKINQGDIVKAGEIITYTATLTNTGNTEVNGLTLDATIPENTTLIELNPNYPSYNEERKEYGWDEEYIKTKEGNTFSKDNISIEAGKNINISFMVRVDENITNEKIVEAKFKLKNNSLTQNEVTFSNKIIPATVIATAIPLYRKPGDELLDGYVYIYRIEVRSTKPNVELNNISVTLNANEAIKVNTVDYKIGEEYKGEITFDNNSKTFDNIPANTTLTIDVETNVKGIIDNNSLLPAIFSANIKDSSNNEYRTNQINENIKGVTLESKLSADIISTVSNKDYLSQGDKIKYVYNIKNIGKYDAEELEIQDEFSKYLNLISLKVNGTEYEYYKEDITLEEIKYDLLHITTQLKSNEEIDLEIIGELVTDLPNEENLKVTNKAKVEYNGLTVTESEQIEHSIKEKDDSSESGDDSGNKENNNEDNDNDSSSNNNVKYHAITGKAWLDQNKNGQRESNEELLSGIKALLYNLDTEAIEADTLTDDNGSYYFTNLKNGNYIVLFEYDNEKYTLTTYMANGIDSNSNSDVNNVTMTIDGQSKKVSATDKLTLNENSIQNIDIGLVETEVFDLHLNKTISKVIVVNNSGTKTTEYNDTNLAKVEIKGKYLNSSTVLVEYKISVKNEGEIAGYAKKIVDYKPTELKFNSKLNPDWYQKGNYLYTNKLQNTKIEPGETKEISLILTKKMTATNTGLVNNKAEIIEYFNSQGIADNNSNEEKSDQADLIISVSTGKLIGFIAITLLLTIAFSVSSYLVIKRILIENFKI